MNDELTVDQRAAQHAALGDATRLSIVDLLSLGDLAPVEVQRQLGVPSNLLAHHLSQLERAGVIARGRSEGDARRSYVRLRPNVLERLMARAPVPARRIVFVCTGNSARSQLAAALWSHASDIPVASAGTHPAPAIEPGAIAVAARRGVGLHAHTPRPLADVLGAADYVVTVCDAAHEELGGRDALHWSIPDPVRAGTDAAFDAAFDELAQRVEALAPAISRY